MTLDALYPNIWQKQFVTNQPITFGRNNYQDMENIKYDLIFKNWVDIVKTIPVPNLERGIELIRLGRSPFIDYPPNAIQFRNFCDLCLPKKPNLPRFDGKPSSPEVAEKHLSKIRSITGAAT